MGLLTLVQLPTCLFSLRYKYSWKLDEARKNLLRTHTTAASARALYRLAQKVQLGLGRGWLASAVLQTF
jgi:hypothetical protein